MRSIWLVGATYEEYGGARGSLQHSVNGGVDWSTNPIFDHVPLRGVYFVDEKNGWVRAEGAIYATHDGGGRWQRELALPGKSYTTFVHFCRAGDCLIALAWKVGNEQVSARVFSRPLVTSL